MSKKIVLPKRVCNRCGHEWLIRITCEPKRCPKCMSAYWNKKRVRQVKNIKVML